MYAIDRTVLSAVLSPMSSSLKLSNAELGLLRFGSIHWRLVRCPDCGASLSDKYGRWRILILGLSVFTSFTWLIGFASSFDEAFTLRLISGLGEGLFWPVAMATVASVYQRRKGLALGFFYVGFDIGSVAGLSIGGIAYYLSDSLEDAFFAAPAVGLIAIFGVLFIRSRLGINRNGLAWCQARTRCAQSSKRKQVIILLVFAFLATWASVWQVVFLPYYFNKVMHLSVPYADFLATPVLIAGGVGKIVLGGISDVWKRNRLLTAVSLVVVGSYLLFFGASNPYLSFFGAIAMGFFSASIFPILQSLMIDNCDGEFGSTRLSTTSQSIATVMGPIITCFAAYAGCWKGGCPCGNGSCNSHCLPCARPERTENTTRSESTLEFRRICGSS